MKNRTPHREDALNLEFDLSIGHTEGMTTKQIVQELLEKLPENVSLHEIAQEIEFVAAVRQGIAEIERGECIPVKDVELELPSWIIK